MNNVIRNNEYWLHVPSFVKKNIVISILGIEIIGYFPYHTARIKGTEHQVCFPRSFIHEFEQILTISHANDNKVVYICKEYNGSLDNCRFAIMLKDDWAIISSWESVVDYQGKEFKLQNNRHTDRDWPCDHCDPTIEPDYCMNICSFKKDNK